LVILGEAQDPGFQEPVAVGQTLIIENHLLDLMLQRKTAALSGGGSSSHATVL